MVHGLEQGIWVCLAAGAAAAATAAAMHHPIRRRLPLLMLPMLRLRLCRRCWPCKLLPRCCRRWCTSCCIPILPPYLLPL